MRDGIEGGTWESHRPKLTYSFDHAPKTGEAVDIEELLWIRLERPLTVEEQLEYEGHVEEARSTRWPRGG